MKNIFLFMVMFVFSNPSMNLYAFEDTNTTLENGDSETYEYQERISGDGIIADDGVVYDSGVSYGQILDDSTVYICRFGCELTLTKTGQTITVEQGDHVIIDNGVLKIK